MIIVDENLNDFRIMAAISAWSPGKVVSITSLRPSSQIKDDVISTLLREAVKPTFVTINVTDFWKRVRPERNCCIITVALQQDQGGEIPKLLRRLFRLPDFKTKALRMGKVIHVTQNHIEYYERDRHIHSLLWPDKP